MSSGLSKKDYLVGTVSRRNANSGLIDIARAGEDSSALASLVVKVSMLLGNANEGSTGVKGVKGVTAETASILFVQDGHLALVSLDDFTELFDKDEILSGLRETMDMRNTKEKSLEVLQVAKMDDVVAASVRRGGGRRVDAGLAGEVGGR
jgi:hypothetical protein